MSDDSHKIQILEDIFKTYHKKLRNRAFNITGDLDAAEDIVQDVFIKIWKNHEKIILGDSIIGYLMKATTNTALNYLKKRNRFEQIREEVGYTLDKNMSVAGDPAHLEELRTSIRKAIDKLPPKCKVIYLLCRHESHSYAEIAEQLDISIKTVENQMGIALKKLRNDLKAYTVLSAVLPPVIILFVWLILNQ